jgi:signal transduction histidine kinase
MSGEPSWRERHDRVLADIARFAGSSLDLQEVLERIVERAAALTGADRASILLLDRSGQQLLPSALWGMDGAFTADWKTRSIRLDAEPLSLEALRSGTPVAVHDAPRDPRTDKGAVAFFGDRSILVAPLTRRGRNLGTLFLNHVGERYDFTPEDVETTAVIASQAAIAIDNARLFGASQRQAAQLRRSFRFAGEALAAGMELQSILQPMVQLAAESVGADGASLRLLDESGRGAYVVVSTGTAPERLEGPQGAVAPEEFPLHSEGRPLGVLALWRVAPPFTAEERELLGAFAGHARIAIEHARLNARLQEEQRRAGQAERTQADFVSMVSHELRTPLALVKAYAATLLRDDLPVTPQKRRSFLEGIAVATDRLQHLIDNLLSATSLDAGLFLSQPAPMEVGAMLRDALEEAELLTENRPLRLEPAPGELWVLGDRQQLTQVVQNLVTNAVKYAPGDSPVVAHVAGTERSVRISVTDSGPGIPPQALELIFEKFYRVEVEESGGPSTGAGGPDSPASTRRPGGMGLGLYICRRIVQAHGGRIWAENPPGGGAAFHIELPRGAHRDQSPSPGQ